MFFFFSVFCSVFYLFIYLFWEVQQKIRYYHFKVRIFCMIIAKQNKTIQKNLATEYFDLFFLHFPLYCFQCLFLQSRINEHETTYSSEQQILIVIAVFYSMFHQLRKTSTAYEYTFSFWNKIKLLTFLSLKVSSRNHFSQGLTEYKPSSLHLLTLIRWKLIDSTPGTDYSIISILCSLPVWSSTGGGCIHHCTAVCWQRWTRCQGFFLCNWL